MDFHLKCEMRIAQRRRHDVVMLAHHLQRWPKIKVNASCVPGADGRARQNTYWICAEPMSKIVGQD